MMQLPLASPLVVFPSIALGENCKITIVLHLYFRNEGFVEFNITSIVNSWHQGTSDNHGVVVCATTENTVVKFYSDDSANLARHAYIEVTCN